MNSSPVYPSRRAFLQASGCGFGMLAFSALAQRALAAEGARSPHFPARARRVLFLFMHGGVSHVDTFDYKPLLQKHDGGKLPFQTAKNVERSTAEGRLLASPWKFRRYGECGHYVSELFPHVAREVDRLCFIHSLHSRGQSHGQAVCMLHTGSDNFVRPSVGAWVTYGLGTENENLPGFVAIAPPRGHGGPRNYGAAFLPSRYQATAIGHSGMPIKNARVDYLQPVDGAAGEAQRRLELVQTLNRRALERDGAEEAIEGAIESFELAFRMQSHMPTVLDLSRETRATQAEYGLDDPATENFGRGCLLARRFLEAGVRYVQLSTPFVWDQHSKLREGHERNARSVDRPIAALLRDLARRGLLEDTLVVWSGEFGRTPVAQGKDGRDHNPQGFTVWMAGAGVKPGFAYGATDEYGYYAVEDKVHMHDFHATLLHLMGLDHTKLTYRYSGRDFRLTDVYGRVVHEIIA